MNDPGFVANSEARFGVRISSYVSRTRFKVCLEMGAVAMARGKVASERRVARRCGWGWC